MSKKLDPYYLHQWSEMRKKAFTFLQDKIGKMTPETLPILQKEMKRLTALWKKDHYAFNKEIDEG
jgi:hypothetical protein